LGRGARGGRGHRRIGNPHHPQNESIYIPIGSVHRLANPCTMPLELIEVQVGSYLGEDYVECLSDRYGRN
jgi:mannose-1-phosphate guanylyltransferase/mannose-6-phosphate isomerase